MILGGSGYVGRHLFQRLGPEQAIATYCAQPLEGGVRFDALTMSLTDVIQAPETISHAVILLGDTSPDRCVEDLARSQALNVDSIISILQQLRRWNIKPIFTSTESVFDGTKGNYRETDEAVPILAYGRQKLEIERYLQSQSYQSVILRLAKVFGSQPQDGTMFTGWMDAVATGETIYCAYDQVCSPIHVNDVAEGIIRVIDADCSGLFHVASRQPYAKIELLEMLLSEVRKYSTVRSEVVPMSINDFPVKERRPLNLSMRPDKFLNSTGLQIDDMGSFCRSFVDDVLANREQCNSCS